MQLSGTAFNSRQQKKKKKSPTEAAASQPPASFPSTPAALRGNQPMCLTAWREGAIVRLNLFLTTEVRGLRGAQVWGQRARHLWSCSLVLCEEVRSLFYSLLARRKNGMGETHPPWDMRRQSQGKHCFSVSSERGFSTVPASRVLSYLRGNQSALAPLHGYEGSGNVECTEAPRLTWVERGRFEQRGAGR